MKIVSNGKTSEFVGIPAGGSTGQALVKASDEDYDVKWATLSDSEVEQTPDPGPDPEPEPTYHIYGVEWDGTATTKWTRTDDAEFFTDPVPAIGNGTGSSPFDALMPWSGMVIEERAGGTEVKEPKYWYKWTKTGKTMKLQIADGPVEGFHVDPVNMDRGDGLGELDFSYIGRYHSAEGWKSETNKPQKSQILRSESRTGIHSIGNPFWQIDFAQFWYVGMLYLVEFADWNSQATIGYGGSKDGSSVFVDNGATDSMQYHTGTTASTRDGGGFTQYRGIEGWWDNVQDWVDGCYYDANGLYVILDPSKFSEDANGVLVGLPSNGFPSEFSIPTQESFMWALYPIEANGSATSYTTDKWTYSSDPSQIAHGGSRIRTTNSGMFYISRLSDSSSNTLTGCRLQERPPKT